MENPSAATAISAQTPARGRVRALRDASLKLLGVHSLFSLAQDLLFLRDVGLWLGRHAGAFGDALVAVAALISGSVGIYRSLVYPLFQWLPFDVPGWCIDLLVVFLISRRVSVWLMNRSAFVARMIAPAEAFIMSHPQLLAVQERYAGSSMKGLSVQDRVQISARASAEVMRATQAAWIEAWRHPDHGATLFAFAVLRAAAFFALSLSIGLLYLIDLLYRTYGP